VEDLENVSRYSTRLEDAELLSAAGYRVHLGGNIGTPLVDKVPEIDSSDYAVVELSSFQLMTMTKSADVAVVTNVSPNHLDYHTGMDEYIEAKKNVFSHQGRDGLLVVNADNETAFGFAAQASGAVRTFSRRAEQANGCWFDGEKIYFCENGEKTILIDKSEVALRGLHNIENLMAAFCAVVDFVGIDMCRRVARQFSGVEHRLEPVREVGGVMYYNDSIASSPTRTIAGLESFDRKLILIAGGYDKHLDYSSLGMAIRDRVKTLVLLGATAPKIKEAVLAAKNGAQPEILEATDMEGAVKLASSHAADGDIVILSPASASFDMFKNFEERGNCFKNIVLAL
jgi:UDP-N-acetylmuramoylalanine--D-glutamate ligase